MTVDQKDLLDAFDLRFHQLDLEKFIFFYKCYGLHTERFVVECRQECDSVQRRMWYHAERDMVSYREGCGIV